MAAIPIARAGASPEYVAEVVEPRLEVRASLAIDALGSSPLIVSAAFPTFSDMPPATAQPMAGAGGLFVPSGHWIAIANIPWELDGTSSYNGPPNGDWLGDYLNPGNWNVTIVKPAEPDPPESFPLLLEGIRGVEFVEWEGKVSDYE